MTRPGLHPGACERRLSTNPQSKYFPMLGHVNYSCVETIQGSSDHISLLICRRQRPPRGTTVAQDHVLLGPCAFVCRAPGTGGLHNICSSCDFVTYLTRFPLTFLSHSSLETLLQSAVATLVPFVFVHNTLPVEPEEETFPLNSQRLYSIHSTWDRTHRQLYVWLLRTLRRKKPLQPSQLDAP